MDIQLLKAEIYRNLAKAQRHVAVMGVYKKSASPKFNEFKYGRAWGTMKAYQTALGIIANMEKKEP